MSMRKKSEVPAPKGTISWHAAANRFDLTSQKTQFHHNEQLQQGEEKKTKIW